MKSYDLVHELTNTAAVFGRKKEVTLVFEGDGAATDGQEILLPALPQGMELSQDDVMVFRGYLDHEAGHVRHTNFDDLKTFVETCSLEAKHIHNCLEDIWLEHRVMEEYPGAEKNLRALTEMCSEKFEKPAVASNPEKYKSVNASSVAGAILWTGRLDYGGDGNKELYDMQTSQFKAWGQKWKELTLKAKSTKELINLALEIEKLLDTTPPEEDMENPQSGKGLGGNPEDFDFDPDGDITRGKDAQKKKGGAGKEEVKVTVGDRDHYFKEWVQSKQDEFNINSKGSTGKYRVYSTRYDEVYEVGKPAKERSRVHLVMEKTSSSEYEKRKARLGGVVNVMKARLRRALLAKETRDWDFGRELGRLDSKRLVAGVLGAPNIYKMRKDRYEMDTAVHFLVDLSGSMGGTKIKVACDSVIALSECLEGTQIKYQVTGFSNYGGSGDIYSKKVNGSFNRVEPLKLHKFKAFEKSLQVSKGSIAAIAESSGGNNSDRDAVIWAYQQLKQRPEKRKILFVLSDGQPANCQFGPNRLDLTKCLKEAIDDCTKAGVECVGIGICDKTVLDIYPKAVSISSVKELSGAIFTQLSNLLTGGKVMF